MGAKIFKRLGAVVVSILLLVYIGFQIYNVTYTGIQTETATYKEVYDSVETTGYIVRNEAVLTSDSAGVLTYLLEDGEKVEKGGKVAEIYASAGDVTAQKRMQTLKAEIDRLKQLSTVADMAYATSPESLDKQISQDLTTMLENINQGSYSKIEASRNDLVYLLNERQIITGKAENFDARIATLQAELDGLTAGHAASTGAVTSPMAGYFISSPDGYENGFSYADVRKLTAEQVKEGPKQAAVSSNTVGKIVSGLNWYVVCLMSPEEAIRIYPGMDGVYLNMPFASTERVPVTVAAVNQTDRSSEAAVVLQCNYMNNELANARQEAIQVDLETKSGIMVSNRAIHFDTVYRTVTDENGAVVKDEEGKPVKEGKRVKGVYVRHGSELNFKEIVEVYASDTFTICDPAPEEGALFNEDAGTVKLYDEVVVKGTDLRDGKIIR